MIDTQPITRRRGDTYRIRVGFTQDDGTPLPLDGTFRLVVTEQSAPTELDAPVMELAGTIVEDGQAGADAIVDFQQTFEDADHVGEMFYEVENTTAAGDIRTILEGPFTMIQDRAKGNPSSEWLASGIDDADVILDGSEFWYGMVDGFEAEIDIKYATRDGRTVVRISGTGSGLTPTLALYPFDNGQEKTIFGNGVFDFLALAYLSSTSELAMVLSASDDPENFVVADLYNAGPQLNSIWENMWAKESDLSRTSSAPSPPAWYWFRLRMDFVSPAVKLKIWEDGDTEPAIWNEEFTPVKSPPDGMPLPCPFFIRMRRWNSADILDLASFKWEKIG